MTGPGLALAPGALHERHPLGAKPLIVDVRQSGSSPAKALICCGYGVKSDPASLRGGLESSDLTAEVPVCVEGKPHLREVAGGRQIPLADLRESAQPVGQCIGMDVQDPGSLIGAPTALHP